MGPLFFPSSAQWREWLEANHAKETELEVGFYKRGSGRPCMSWSEAVDEALCFGWIDGVRKAVGPSSYAIRFGVRKKGSIWSNVNIAKAESLIARGRMRAAGQAKFLERTVARSGVYSFEQGAVDFDADSAAEFKENGAAWEFFQGQPPSYRKKMTWLVVSARQPATRKKRLALLIDACSNRKRIG